MNSAAQNTITHHQAFASADYSALRSAIAWHQRSVRVYGKSHPQPRLTCWYGPCAYTYSGLTWPALEMPADVELLRQLCERATGERFDSVLCNLYRDGSDTVGWHADDEPLFGGDPVVASLSFGAARKFAMKRRDGSERRNFMLEDGDLLAMGRGVQRDWLHSVPRTRRAVGERINMTFRTVTA